MLIIAFLENDVLLAESAVNELAGTNTKKK